MNYPRLNQKKTYRIVTNTFAGYNHKLKIEDGEFYNTGNLTSKNYPLFSTRNLRGTLDREFTNLQAIIAKDALYWVDNGTLYANGYPTGLTGLQTSRETQLVSMGAYICVFPDKKYINTMDLSDYGNMGADWSYSGDVVYTMCHQDGSYYNDVTKSETEPDNPANGAIWIDTITNTVKEYTIWTKTWTVVETVYTRVDFVTQGQIPSGFREYDGVRVEGMQFEDLNGSKILYAVGGEEDVANDFVVLIGIQEERTEETGATIRIRRVVPDMDYVCEAQNRLWGCFYGNDGTQNLNEIYCCALGDFRNWEQYLGLSTDSWRASRGSDGVWTGCVNMLGSPTFFKENVIHPISVSSSGAHQIGDIPARGVQEGSHRSLAVVNETLLYKSRSGVMAYQGGIPVSVSDALGDEKYYDAVAGVFGQQYYISMRDSSDVWHFFCFDMQTGIWMREDNLHAEGFAQWGDELYVQSDNSIITINGTEGEPEESLEWFAETGILHTEYPDRKYVSRYDIRINMDRGASVKIFIEYDSSGLWQYQGTVMLPNTGTATIPVRPRRCDHLRLRFEGNGGARIFSIARTLTQGSDA